MSISAEVEKRVYEAAGYRCGYCLAAQQYILGWLEIEHLHPISLGGTDDEKNLWVTCRFCNNFKSNQTQADDPETGLRVALFNPRKDTWTEHFKWSEDGVQIIGVTPRGRATVIALRINYEIALMVRRNWVAVGWHPPKS